MSVVNESKNADAQNNVHVEHMSIVLALQDVIDSFEFFLSNKTRDNVTKQFPKIIMRLHSISAKLRDVLHSAVNEIHNCIVPYIVNDPDKCERLLRVLRKEVD